MIDRLLAYALFVGFIIAAVLGWDWDTRAHHCQHTTGKGGEGDRVGRVSHFGTEQ